MRNFLASKDRESSPIYGPKISDTGYGAYLAPDTIGAVAIPSNAVWALCSFTGYCYVSYSTFTLPSTGTFTPLNARIMGELINVSEATMTDLYFRSPIATYVQVEFFAK